MSSATQQFTTLLQSLQLPTISTDDAALRNELVVTYIALWYYSATTNIWASFSLPPVQEFDHTITYHALVKQVIDRSFADFQLMTSLVNQLTDAQIQASTIRHLYDEVRLKAGKNGEEGKIDLKDVENDPYLAPYKHFIHNPFFGCLEKKNDDKPEGFSPDHFHKILKHARKKLKVSKTTVLNFDTKLKLTA